MKKQTDSGFVYEIKGNHVVILTLEGEPQLVEIPEQLEGLPVTELGEYLFPEKNVRRSGFLTL